MPPEVAGLMVHQLLVNRNVEFGEVYLIRDELLTFPESDRVGNRTPHPNRRVAIVQNNQTNYGNFPLVLVAPLSTKIEHLRRFDILLDPQNEAVVDRRAGVRLSLIQPVLRADLGDCLGEMSRDKQAEMMQALLGVIGQEN